MCTQGAEGVPYARQRSKENTEMHTFSALCRCPNELAARFVHKLADKAAILRHTILALRQD